MRIDIDLESAPEMVAHRARSAQDSGFDGAFFSEIRSDPFPAVSVAAQVTSDLTLGTAVAIAFARNPMQLAMCGRDAQVYARGRFMMGIGSQIQPHITKRYSMPWSRPAARMRDYIGAIRAIWHTYETGARLDFRGDFYTHTLMTPAFDAGPTGYGTPPILLGAVGRRMTLVAAEVADGVSLHPFVTRHYLRTEMMPIIEAARAAAGLPMDGYTVRGMPYIATGPTPEALAAATAEIRKLIAFHGSTPAYRPVLEAHGWGDLQDELNRRSKQGRWAEMAELVDDDVLHTIAVVGEPATIAPELLRRYGDTLTRLAVFAPYEVPDGFWEPVVAQLTRTDGARHGRGAPPG